ncbi:hypothetical protein [Lactococcus termiticola]|uniref:Uncharacterized protein n=1 Tax=Lactococcus termiticola TaxID=2169526 RepID=A0A2R5HEC7_9LACT|nr:hypothetical protein [Lactococcus termiticola]GBG96444.1 hypothetical protein NtB2_00556 [Lactococcus termiticola]
MKNNEKHVKHPYLGITAGLLALIIATSVAFFIPPHPDYEHVPQRWPSRTNWE